MLNNLGPCPAQRDEIVIGTTVHVGTAVGRYTDRKLGLADMPCAVQCSWTVYTSGGGSVEACCLLVVLERRWQWLLFT